MLILSIKYSRSNAHIQYYFHALSHGSASNHLDQPIDRCPFWQHYYNQINISETLNQ